MHIFQNILGDGEERVVGLLAMVSGKIPESVDSLILPFDKPTGYATALKYSTGVHSWETGFCLRSKTEATPIWLHTMTDSEPKDMLIGYKTDIKS